MMQVLRRAAVSLRLLGNSKDREIDAMEALLSHSYHAFRKSVHRYPFHEARTRLHHLVDAWNKAPADCHKKSDFALLKQARNELVSELNRYLDAQVQLSERLNQNQHQRLHYIPEFNPDGLLPPVACCVPWQLFAARFGYTPRRRLQLQALLAALTLLKHAKCSRAEIGGSFVTAKVNPDDIDCHWLASGIETPVLEPMLGTGAFNNRDELCWRNVRPHYFGIDGTCLENDKDILKFRSIIKVGYEYPKELGPVPSPQPVGFIELDLTQQLPVAECFVPFGTRLGENGCVVSTGELSLLRERLPQHFVGITNDVLKAHGVYLLEDSWPGIRCISTPSRIPVRAVWEAANRAKLNAAQCPRTSPLRGPSHD
jgi:hypothetical protein